MPMPIKHEELIQLNEPRHGTYRKSFCQHFFAFPPHLTGHLEKLHVAVCEVRSMVGIKDEHTPVGGDGPLTRREQRAMLLFIYFVPKTNVCI